MIAAPGRLKPLALAASLLASLLSASAWAQAPGVLATGDPRLKLSTGITTIPSVAAKASGPQRAASASAEILSQPLRYLPRSSSCQDVSADSMQSLSLTDALAHVLCKSPAVRQALFSIQEQGAGVELAQAAFRPRLFLSSELAANHTPSSNINAASDSSSLTTGLSLSWMLFDFGVRSANLEQARQQLASVLTQQDAVVLGAITATLQIYTDAATAWMRLAALREAESVAARSLQAAQAKYEAQVGSLAEKLQAQTALAQATLDRVRADGVWQTARGSLASAMGFPVSQAIQLASLEDAFPQLPGNLDGVALIEEARQVHPRLISLRSDIKAAQARLDAVRSGNWGTVNLSGSAYETRGLGTGSSNPPDRRLSGSVYLSVPLFNGREQQALESQALAQIGTRESSLQSAERDIETDIWKSAQLVQTETENAAAARQLLASSELGYQVAFGRYKAGVGSILELLTAQSALANANSQFNQAQLAIANARLKLSVSTGRFGAR